MFNNIKWWARAYSANWCLCEWEERVVASNVHSRLFAAIHFVDTRLFTRNIEMIT